MVDNYARGPLNILGFFWYDECSILYLYYIAMSREKNTRHQAQKARARDQRQERTTRLPDVAESELGTVAINKINTKQ